MMKQSPNRSSQKFQCKLLKLENHFKNFKNHFRHSNVILKMILGYSTFQTRRLGWIRPTFLLD